MTYIGKKCPYCQTELTEADEIVVCSNCDMPHHKDCWIENKGCTTFGCTGTIQNTSKINQNAQIDNNKVKFCTRCGKSNNTENNFCSSCGSQLSSLIPNQPNTAYTSTYTPLNNINDQNYYNSQTQQNAYINSQNQNNNGNPNNMFYQTENDIAEFVKNNANYYVSKFNGMKLNNSTSSWNWASFLFPIYWCFYRKMYLNGSILMAIYAVSLFTSSIGWVINLGSGIALGILGNNFYMKYVEQHIRISSRMPMIQKQQYYAGKGGTSVGATVGVIIIVFILAFVAASIAGGF